MTKMNLIVLRVQNIETEVAFYRALGLTFKDESHGSGPWHYASSTGECTLELYPAEGNVSAPIVVGLAVNDMEAAYSTGLTAGGKGKKKPGMGDMGYTAALYSPTGHIVLLTQLEAAELSIKEKLTKQLLNLVERQKQASLAEWGDDPINNAGIPEFESLMALADELIPGFSQAFYAQHPGTKERMRWQAET